MTDAEAEDLKARLEAVLAQVHQAVGDWEPMKALLDEAMVNLENHAPRRRQSDRDEALDFLKWLRSDNFTFLGMRDYGYSGEGETAVVDRGTGRASASFPTRMSGCCARAMTRWSPRRRSLPSCRGRTF